MKAGEDAALAPAIVVGAVMHARRAPVARRFSYPLFTLRLPLTRGAALDRPGPVSVLARDHGPRDGSPLLPWIRALLAREGIAADGEVVLQTMPRLLGYLFNPVSFWFCHDRGGRLRAVLAEVSNTFGEHHNYLVGHPDGRVIADGEMLAASKVFHVSPFFPVRGEYRFRFSQRGCHHAVSIDYHEGGRLLLETRLSGRARPLTRGALAATLASFPLMTLAVTLRIHLQALRLWLSGATLFRKPLPPDTETSR